MNNKKIIQALNNAQRFMTEISQISQLLQQEQETQQKQKYQNLQDLSNKAIQELKNAQQELKKYLPNSILQNRFLKILRMLSWNN